MSIEIGRKTAIGVVRQANAFVVKRFDRLHGYSH